MHIRNKFIIFSTLFTTLLFSLFTLVHLNYTAERALSDFKGQNYSEIQTGDTFGLANRLDALIAHGFYRCVRVKKSDVLIYTHAIDNCGFSVFDKSVTIHPMSGGDILISMTLATPLYVKGFVIAIMISLISLITLTFRHYQNIHDHDNLFYREMFDLTRRTAHDIRSPLTAIQMLATQYSEENRAHGQLLQSASNRLESIALDLLRRSKNYQTIYAGTKPSIEEIPISKLLDACEKILSEKKLAHSDHQFKLIRDNSTINDCFLGDQLELERIISNLLNNSIESFAKPGGTVILKVIGKRKQYLELEIQDNGCGMPKKMLRRLGQSLLVSTKVDGSGIGVFFAKKFLASWGGSLIFTSKSDVGTTATIRLKLA